MFLCQLNKIVLILVIKKKLFTFLKILICISFIGKRFHLVPPNKRACWIVWGGPTNGISAIYKLSANIHKFAGQH